MTEADVMDTLKKWSADTRLKNVCQKPLCRLHAHGSFASVVWRRALKMFSHDEHSDSMVRACDDDEDIVHGLTVAPLTKEEIDFPEADVIAYMLQHIEDNITEIKNDPTQQNRPECSNTTETHLFELGTKNVFFPCCWRQTIFKVTDHERDRESNKQNPDTFSDMTVPIRLDADLRRWLISIEYIKPNAYEIDPREKDAKTKKPKVGRCGLTPTRSLFGIGCVFNPFQT
jgi:hypothetical protein